MCIFLDQIIGIVSQFCCTLSAKGHFYCKNSVFVNGKLHATDGDSKNFFVLVSRIEADFLSNADNETTQQSIFF